MSNLSAFTLGVACQLKHAGIDASQHDQLLAQLAMLQHHLDDAESYSGQGLKTPAHLSLDDAEEGVERISEQVLPPQKAQVVEQVAEQGDEEEQEKGVEDPEVSPEEGSSEGAFELGLRHGLKKAGFSGYRLEAMVDLARAHGMGEIKTAEDITAVVLPYAAADAHEKRAAEESHPFNKVIARALAMAQVH